MTQPERVQRCAHSGTAQTTSEPPLIARYRQDARMGELERNRSGERPRGTKLLAKEPGELDSREYKAGVFTAASALGPRGR